ncbi:putative Se/S carrier-like protein [Coprothermobacter platensis]|uniref:DUF3343 domain-containing protein n=1 Tax=Coprothermobacter platensis TaxID=108819 RepID=UPI00036680FE
MERGYFIITFPSVHQAMAFEDEMKRSTLLFQLVPVPRQISASCGEAAKVWNVSQDDLLEIIKLHGVVFSAIYHYDNQDSQPNLIMSS